MSCLRYSTIMVAAVLLAAVRPTDVTTQDVAGTWVLSVALDVGTGDATFVFVVDSNEISGTYSGVLGDQEVTGTIEGNTVKFGFSSDGTGETTFEGTIDGDTMEGTCDYDLLGPGTFSGKRSGP